MKALEKMNHLIRKVVLMVLVVLLTAGISWAKEPKEHDLVIKPAPDVTSSSSADWKSPDIKIGADFGVASPPDIIQRGVPNHIYARFLINGTKDHELSSGDAWIEFYWRNATVGSTPPALSHSSWNYIDKLYATYVKSSDGPFAITRIWPTSFPSVTDKYVTWTAPQSGDKFHIAAKLVYATVTDDYPGDNAAVSLYESQSGLLDVVVVLDISGSMGMYTYGGYTYLQHAVSKTSMFLASMPQAHRFSVVAFPDGYPMVFGYKNVWPKFPPWLRPAADPNKFSAIAAVAGLNAVGWTPMGMGLQRAIQVLTTPLVPDRKRVIVLLSDGEENWGTPRACPGTNPLDKCVGSTLLSQLTTNNIKVFTVALGTQADKNCLKCLATKTGGKWYSSPSASITLAKVYLDLQQSTSSDDLYRVDQGVTGFGTNSYSTYFEGKDNSLYFILSWDDLAAKLDLEIQPPQRISLQQEVFSGDGYLVIKVYNPPKGTWKYTVNGPGGKKYLAAVRSDHVGVRMSMTAIAEEGIVGLPVKIKAQLTDGKIPITEARVSAEVQMPVGPSLETILQQTSREHILGTRRLPVDPNVLRERPDVSARGEFIKRIMGDRGKLVETKTVRVPLKHTGKGFYEGFLSEEYTTTAGEYDITVKCYGEGFHREFAEQVRLNPGEIDYERSSADVVMIEPTSREEEEGPTWLLRVHAVDRFGNAIIDPSLIERVKSEVRGAKVSKSNITLGTIQQKLSSYEGQRPELEKVTLDGRPIRIEHRE
jgi:hypothetical protein